MIIPPRPAAPADVARHYDELDRYYRELWGEHLHHGFFVRRDDDPQMAAARLVRMVADYAVLQPGQDVCDVGCGYGATARQIADAYRVHVTGLTLSKTQVDYAREHTRPESSARFFEADWLDNEFPDASFDAVLAIECLAHMPDKSRFFHEVVRTLRPGGRLVVCAWLTREDPPRWARRFLLEPLCEEGALAGMGSASEYQSLMAEAGMRSVTTNDLTPNVTQTWRLGTRRLAWALLRNPDYRQALRDPRLASRTFALAVVRIRMAYGLGVMRYGLFTARKPGGTLDERCPP